MANVWASGNKKTWQSQAHTQVGFFLWPRLYAKRLAPYCLALALWFDVAKALLGSNQNGVSHASFESLLKQRVPVEAGGGGGSFVPHG